MPMITGADALERYAPDAGQALDGIVATMWSDMADAGLGGVVASIGGTASDLLHLPPLPPPDSVGLSGEGTADDDAVRAFAEQTCLDVASVTKSQRAAFQAAAGDRAGNLAAALLGGRVHPPHPGRPRRPVHRGSVARGRRPNRWPAGSGSPSTASSGPSPPSTDSTPSPRNWSVSAAPASTTAGCAGPCATDPPCGPGPPRRPSRLSMPTPPATSPHCSGPPWPSPTP